MKSIRSKTLFTLTVILILLFTLQIASVYQSFAQSYNDLEELQIKTDIRRVQNTIEHHLIRLAKVAKDTAGWDDTYEFMLTRDQEWLENNFTWEVLKLFDSDTLVITDLDDRIIHAEHRTMEGGLLDVPKEIIDQVTKNHLISIDKNERILRYGLASIGTEVLLLGYYNITNTNENLEPRGRLLYGRLLNEEKISDLSEITQLDISIKKIGLNSAGEKGKNATHNIRTRIIDNDTIDGSIILKDVFGNPVVEIVVTKKRQFFQYGKETIDYFSINSVIFGLILVIGMLLLMDNWVLKRIITLSREVKRLGSAPDLSQRITVRGNDEIDQLAMDINATLDELSVYFSVAQESSQVSFGTESIQATLIIDSTSEKILSARFYPDVIAGRNYGRVAGLHYNDLLKLDDDKSLTTIIDSITLRPKQTFSAVLTPAGIDPIHVTCRFSVLASVRKGLILCRAEVKQN